jgi:UDP-glucuronate 4-epimerase
MFCSLQDCHKDICHHCFPVLNCSLDHENCKINGKFKEILDKNVILVTGCAGFIGSHVCEFMLKKGFYVYGIDNMHDNYDVLLKEQNVQILEKYKNFKFSKEDICTTKIVSKVKPYKIIHLASMSGVRNSLNNPMDYVDSNIKGFVNILEQSKDNNVFHITYASSSSVYGLNDTPFFENDIINKCNSPYAASKKCMEVFAQTYSQLYNIPIIGLRFFTVYGPRGRPDMAPYMFLDSIHKGNSITQFGDGSSSRDYTYIDDIVNGIFKATNHFKTDIFNLGNSKPTTLIDFIKTIEEVTEKTAKINIIENQKGDVPTTCANIEYSNKILGYTPIISLKDGLQEMYNDYVKYNSKKNNINTLNHKL